MTFNQIIEQCEKGLGTLFGDQTILSDQKFEESGEIHYIVRRKFDGFQVGFDVCCQGKLHRKAGPARFRFHWGVNGGTLTKEWYEQGKLIKREI